MSPILENAGWCVLESISEERSQEEAGREEKLKSRGFNLFLYIFAIFVLFLIILRSRASR